MRVKVSRDIARAKAVRDAESDDAKVAALANAPKMPVVLHAQSAGSGDEAGDATYVTYAV